MISPSDLVQVQRLPLSLRLNETSEGYLEIKFLGWRLILILIR